MPDEVAVSSLKEVLVSPPLLGIGGTEKSLVIEDDLNRVIRHEGGSQRRLSG